MAFIDDKTLLKLPVYTRSGSPLGKVAGFELDVETQAVLRWFVRPKGIAASVLKRPLIVAREQVLSITAERMTVEDAVAKAMELEKAKAIGLVSNVEA